MIYIALFCVLFALILFSTSGQSTGSTKTHYRFVAAALIGVAAVFFTGSAIRQVDTGEVAVQKLFGRVQSNVLRPGIHMVNPVVSTINYDIRTQNYTMSAVHDEGDKTGDDAIRVLSADGLEVVIDLTVLYRVDAVKAPDIESTVGEDYEDKIVRPISRTRVRDNAVFYDAVSLYSTSRAEFQARILKSISDEFNKRGLVLEQLLIRNIQLPKSVKSSIEQKISAEQEAQKMQFVVQKEQREADRKRAEAQGIADYHRIISSGLNENQLRYEEIQVQKVLARSPNSKVIVLGNGQKSNLMLDAR